MAGSKNLLIAQALWAFPWLLPLRILLQKQPYEYGQLLGSVPQACMLEVTFTDMYVITAVS